MSHDSRPAPSLGKPSKLLQLQSLAAAQLALSKSQVTVHHSSSFGAAMLMHFLAFVGLRLAAASRSASSSASRSAACASRSNTSTPIRSLQITPLASAHISVRSMSGHASFIVLHDSHVSSVHTTGSVAASSANMSGRQNG
eukprot:scaffold41746_cov67-Phaeocystis_antarctica.AAC.5